MAPCRSFLIEEHETHPTESITLFGEVAPATPTSAFLANSNRLFYTGNDEWSHKGNTSLVPDQAPLDFRQSWPPEVNGRHWYQGERQENDEAAVGYRGLQ